ncbi:large ribosomal subunit protein mL42 [Lepisosteus oculatus]|uniref:large ribosomal subunit protein mL42 n=1 Tax=Lepisosteus oculatus TaxID=7918 RepID=UPI003718FCE9
MAAGQAFRLSCLYGRLLCFAKPKGFQAINLKCTHPKSTHRIFSEDYSCKVDLALTSDGRTIVCYHPAVDVPYEHTQPIPQPDPLNRPEETHDQVLKAHLNKEVLRNKQAPTIEELSKMFYTTKHRWYPVGQYHRRRKKTDPPRDR